MNSKLEKPKWLEFNGGTYNKVFRSSTAFNINGYVREWVLKIPKTQTADSDIEINSPTRFLRKHRKINKSYPAFLSSGYTIQFLDHQPASSELTRHVVYLRLDTSGQIIATYLNDQSEIKIMNISPLISRSTAINHANCILWNAKLQRYDEYTTLDAMRLRRPGTVMPYLGKEQARDAEIAAKVLDIYLQSRNIIIDASVPGNFLKYGDDVVCVDLDCAIQRGSFDSDQFMTGSMRDEFQEFWNTEHDLNPLTIDIIRTLFYLEHFLAADQITDEYLTTEVMHKLNICRQKRIQLERLDPDTLVEIITYYPDHSTHEQRLSMSVLSAIQASTEPDRFQVIHDAFTRPTPIEQQIYDTWASYGHGRIAVRNELSVFGFFAAPIHTTTDESDQMDCEFSFGDK